MTRDLPTPDEILEELADKTAAQIDRLAPIAFDRALGELTRYHRFLLEMSASRTSDGAVFNFAEIAGDAWGPPHRDWVRQYRRLFERAADRLPNDAHFLTSLAHVPGRLLGSGDPELPASIVEVILDLEPMMMHRLEAWVTKRTTIETPKGQSAEPRLALVGSDAKAYAGVLPDIVGAWESLLQRVPSMYDWRERADKTEEERWNALRQSWPFLWQHLTNTAYCLAVAVWNEDESGAALFRDALVRWPDILKYRLDDAGAAAPRSWRLIFPDLLKMDWHQASAKASLLDYDYLPLPTTDHVLANIIRGAHDDVVFLTAAVLLSWTINDKQSSDIGGRAARMLLIRAADDDNGHTRNSAPLRLRSLLLELVRTEIAGERFSDDSYGAELDHLVKSLDDMTERRVVPGRVYTPSTMHERSDLLVATLAILASGTPLEGDDGVGQSIADLAEEEELLPGGDRSLRDILHELGRFRTTLLQPSALIERGVGVLTLGQEAATKVRHLGTILASAHEVLATKRQQRLLARPVDGDKLEALRLAVEAALLRGPSRDILFSAVEIARGPGGSIAETQSLTFNGIEKAAFVEPPMQAASSSFNELFVTQTQVVAARSIWAKFLERERVNIDVAAKLEEEAFWRGIERFVLQVGIEPVMAVSQHAALRTRRLFGRHPSAELGWLRVERRKGKGNSYVATVQGVDVIDADVPPGVALLFSARALQRVRYQNVDVGKYVAISFELGEGVKGAVRLSFRQQLEWANTPTFEIRAPDPDDS